MIWLHNVQWSKSLFVKENKKKIFRIVFTFPLDVQKIISKCIYYQTQLLFNSKHTLYLCFTSTILTVAPHDCINLLSKQIFNPSVFFLLFCILFGFSLFCKLAALVRHRISLFGKLRKIFIKLSSQVVWDISGLMRNCCLLFSQ